MNVHIGEGRLMHGRSDVRPAGISVQLVHVSKSFNIKGRTLPVLRDISLNIAPREFVVIVGASGCGKSTLLRLVAGLDKPDSGEVKIDGRKIEGPGLDRGIVFQDHRLLPWLTAEQNVAAALIPLAVSKAERLAVARRCLAQVGLAGFESALPAQLSGGMAQRAAIGRALANDPAVLLLDEPLGALDALTRLKLQNEIADLSVNHPKTVVLVTHDIEEAAFFADRIVVMDAAPGRIRKIIPVDLPRPRDRTGADFVELRRQVLREFVEDTAVEVRSPGNYPA